MESSNTTAVFVADVSMDGSRRPASFARLLHLQLISPKMAEAGHVQVLSDQSGG